MIISDGYGYRAVCDLCGFEELYTARHHSDAWSQMRQHRWLLSKGDANRLHVCHECPPPKETSHANAQNPSPTDHD